MKYTSSFADTIITAHLASFLLALPCCFSSVEIWAPDVADALGWSPTVCHPQAQELEPKPLKIPDGKNFQNSRTALKTNDHVLSYQKSAS
jgi:hypothetical protein